jgi:hypothetical protein
MSSQPKKKTIAQLRAENEQRDNDFMYGVDLATEVLKAQCRVKEGPDEDAEVQYEERKAILVQADRALDQLKHFTDTEFYRARLHSKAVTPRLHRRIQHGHQQTDELLLEAERNGLIN